MNEQDRRGAASTPGHEQTATALERPQSQASRQASRPCVALIRGSWFQQHTDDFDGLLRHRLRVAGLIWLSGSILFLLKGFLHHQAVDAELFKLPQVLHGILVAFQLMLCAILWTDLPLSTRSLRLIELALFGSAAAFFAFLQFRIYSHGEFFTWVTADHREDVMALANFANSFRWFVLIVLYGVFIPNTWKRCAQVVGAMAAAPLVLNFVTCFPCVIMGDYTWPVLFDTSVVVGLGAAIAIFGSYKISELREEAMQARKLGQYRLQRRLGAGGMGEVYLGEHTLLRRACAIKLIRPDQAGDPTTFSRFEREVQAMATLTHWNTVEVYDYGHAEDGTFYYVMEYLPGLSLQDMVDTYGPLPAGRAIHFLRQICAGLREAHAIGLIHRDIKPSNVIVCTRGAVYDVAKLLDFGLVHDIGLVQRSEPQLTLQGSILGSPPYISPEQARGRGPIDARTDIYSLGGLAYFLLTGRTPFVRETIMELLVAQLHDAPTPPRHLRPEIPADLEEIVLTCLQKDPDGRFADVESLDRALARCEAVDEWDTDQAELWWASKGTPEIADVTVTDGEVVP